MSDIIVTTGDLKRDYEVIGPVIFEYRTRGFLYGEYSVGQGDFEKAFYIAVHELRNAPHFFTPMP